MRIIILFNTAFFLGNEIVVSCSSLVSFLSLESCEYRTRSLHVVKQLFLLDSIEDFFINLSNFLPFFALNVCSSSLEPINDFLVLVSKSDLCNLLMMLIGSIKHQIRHFCDSLFKLKLHVKLELGDLWNRVSLIPIIFRKVIKQLISDIELNGVITGCDCLNIEVNKLCFLNTFNVIKVNNCEKVDEHGDRSSNQSKYLSLS